MSGISGIFKSLLSVWSDRSVGKALLVLGLAVCVYQAWRKWYIKRLIAKKLRGKVVLITGASSGLGEALARVFHVVGAKIILAARNLQQLEELKFQLDSKPRKENNCYSPKILALDLTDTESLPGKVQEVVRHYGRVDILVNNAGVSSRSSAMETQDSVNRAIMEVNFFGTVALTKELLPTMLEQGGGGQIVVISSLQGKIGIPYRSSYAASKHALQGYFDSLRCELAPESITVTLISPGYIKTRLSLNALTGDGTKHGVMDTNTMRGMSPLHASQAMLLAVAEGKRELILASPIHQLAVYLRVLCPSLLDWALKQNIKHPTGSHS